MITQPGYWIQGPLIIFVFFFFRFQKNACGRRDNTQGLTEEVVSTRSVENLKLFFRDRFIILDNVLFVPGIKENLN